MQITVVIVGMQLMAKDLNAEALPPAGPSPVEEQLLREVEARQRAEVSLQEALARLEQFESIVANSSAVFFRWRLAEGWPVEFISDNVRQFGYSPDEILSGKLQLMDVFHPDDGPRMRDEVVQYLAEGRKAFNQSYRIINKLGEIRHVQDWNLVVTDYDGKPAHIQGLALDVTDRKKAEDALRLSEERYRALLAGVPDMIFRIRSDGTYLDFSPGHDSSPYVPPTEFLGRTVLQVLPEEIADPLMSRIDVAVKTGENQLYEYQLERDGERRDREARLVRGSQDEVFVVVRDITERNRTQLALQQTLRLASVGTLAAGIAHEINNPIAAVLTAAETALSVCDDPQSARMVKECLENVVSSATRCAGIVRNVLKFARHEPTEKSLHPLHEILDRALNHARAFLVPDNATLVVDEHLDGSEVLVNPLEIEQVVANLIQNAVRAADGPVTVHVSTERSPTGVQFKVSDDGRGMTEEEKAHAFDPFFTTRQQDGGTGLGLSIAYSVVHDHGGSIEVDSRLGHGATVTVELPLPERKQERPS